MTITTHKYLILVAILISIVLGMWVAMMMVQSEVDEKVVAEDEWCLVADLPATGGSFGSPRPGEDSYQVISTTDGFKVYQKCGKNSVREK